MDDFKRDQIFLGTMPQCLEVFSLNMARSICQTGNTWKY